MQCWPTCSPEGTRGPLRRDSPSTSDSLRWRAYRGKKDLCIGSKRCGPSRCFSQQLSVELPARLPGSGASSAFPENQDPRVAIHSLFSQVLLGSIALEHFSCCWVSREERAAAFSLRKTSIDALALHYTYRRNALLAKAVAPIRQNEEDNSEHRGVGERHGILQMSAV